MTRIQGFEEPSKAGHRSFIFQHALLQVLIPEQELRLVAKKSEALSEHMLGGTACLFVNFRGA